MDEEYCEKCGYKKHDPCCSYAEERENFKYQLKMEQVLKESYSKIIRRLEEKLQRLEAKKEEQEDAEIPKETPDN